MTCLIVLISQHGENAYCSGIARRSVSVMDACACVIVYAREIRPLGPVAGREARSPGLSGRLLSGSFRAQFIDSELRRRDQGSRAASSSRAGGDAEQRVRC